jgi:hypothetical protein
MKSCKAETIPNSIKGLLAKLEFISMIERGKKPCFTDMTFVISTSWLGALKRMSYGENKKNLLFEIGEIIDQSALAIEEFNQTPYQILLLDNLVKAKLGLENLILTYASHPNTVAKLRVYIMNLEMILKKYNYQKDL